MSSYLFLQKMTRWRGVLFLLYQMEWKSFHNVFWCVSSAQMESFPVALTCKASPSSLFFLKSFFSLFYSLVRQFDHRPSCEVSSLRWVHFFFYGEGSSPVLVGSRMSRTLGGKVKCNEDRQERFPLGIIFRVYVKWLCGCTSPFSEKCQWLDETTRWGRGSHKNVNGYTNEWVTPTPEEVQPASFIPVHSCQWLYGLFG